MIREPEQVSGKATWTLINPFGTVKIENKQSYKAALILLEILKSEYEQIENNSNQLKGEKDSNPPT